MPCGGRQRDTCRQHEAKEARVIATRTDRGRQKRRCYAPWLFLLPFACQDAAELGYDILPRQRCAEGDVVPGVRARLDILATQNTCKYTPVEVDEVIQARLR
jgi:hypothetical protein